jgi:peptide/nickel transport system substrate-binding protein
VTDSDGNVVGTFSRREVLQRLGVGGALLAAGPGLLAACGSSSSSPSGSGVTGAASDAEFDSFTLASGPISNLDVASAFVGTSLAAMALGLEAPVAVGTDLSLKPGLAEKWSQPDPLRYVYTIRSGVKFWDGTPLTAEDVAFSIARHLDPKLGSQIASYMTNAKSVEVTGPSEVTVHMKRPDPLFAYIPTFTFVTPKAFSEKLGKKLGVAGPQMNTMGTGPFRLTSFSETTGVKAVRNETYWGTKPKVKNVNVNVIANPATIRLALQSGAVDGTIGFPLNESKSYDRLAQTNTYYPAPLGVIYLSLNLATPPFDDVHVRRAVAYSLDRAGYIHAFLGGHAIEAEALTPKGQWGTYVPASEVDAIYAKIPQYEFSVAKAKAELAKSSHPNGFKARIGVPSSRPYMGQAMVNLSQTLKQIGVTLDVHEQTDNAWIADLFSNTVPMLISGASPDYADPGDFIVNAYSAAQAFNGGFNTANFKNAEVERLIKQSNATSDHEARAKALAGILKIAGEQIPYVPLWWQPTPVALNRKFVWPGYNALYYYQPWATQISLRA